MPEARNQVIAWLKRNAGSTATQIVQGALGKTKARDNDKEMLGDLVHSGELIEDCSGRYTTYSVAGGRSVSAAPASQVAEVKSGKDVPAMKLDGFTAKWQGNKLKITAPDGQIYELDEEEFVLVINNRVEYVVKSPADVLSAITDYTTERGISTFTIKDLIGNKEIKNAGDIVLDEGRILCFKLEKHNKAA